MRYDVVIRIIAIYMAKTPRAIGTFKSNPDADLNCDEYVNGTNTFISLIFTKVSNINETI